MNRYFPDRGQALVGMRREVVPDVAGKRIGRERRAGVGLQQSHRHAQIGREKVVGREIIGQREAGHRLLEPVALGVAPVIVPAFEVIGARTGLLLKDTESLFGELARVASGTALGKHDLAAIERALVA